MKIMKALIFTILATSSQWAMALPNYVAVWNQTPGFIKNPKIQTIYLQRNAQILLIEEDSEGHRTRQILGRLNTLTFQNTLKKIASVMSASTWTDLNPDDPACSDMPAQFISVVQGDHLVKTFEHSRCHTWTFEDGSADAINDVMSGLSALAQ